MNERGEQKVINVSGVIYDAVILPKNQFGCEGFAFSANGISCLGAGCLPVERDDGMYAIWKRRITHSSVEATL
jgi:hypothetical protein